MEKLEISRNGQTDQFSVVLSRGDDTIRCIVSVDSGHAIDAHSDKEKGGSIIGAKNASAKSRGYSKAVADIQLNLKRLGYDLGPIDGLLGPKTKAAIAQFEGAQGLSPGRHIGELVEDAEQTAPRAQENRRN